MIIAIVLMISHNRPSLGMRVDPVTTSCCIIKVISVNVSKLPYSAKFLRAVNLVDFMIL